MDIKEVRKAFKSKRRPDHNDFLCHFTRQTKDLSPYKVLLKIASDRYINPGKGYVLADCHVTCFTETPIQFMEFDYRYSPFGIIMEKTEIFELGGRPVIYQPKSEYRKLPPELRYRHMSFNPCEGLDFTWEREWRVPSGVDISDENACLLVRTKTQADRLWVDLEFEWDADKIISYEELGVKIIFNKHEKSWSRA